MPNTAEQAALRLLRTTPGALCTIMRVDGSFSRAPGAQLAITQDDQFAGSLSDGCLERELALQAAAARSAGGPVVLRYGAGSPWIDFRLPCGAGIDVLVDPFPNRAEIEQVCKALDARRPAALTLPVTEAFGSSMRTFEPALRILAFGSGPELRALVRLANAAGIETDMRVAGGPGLALGQPPSGCTADACTAIILLFHDHEWEEEILLWALATEAFYIGSIGGDLARRARLQRLSDRGVEPADVARVRSPVGVIRSARDPMTLAISILAEVVAEDQERRRKRSPLHPGSAPAVGVAALRGLQQPPEPSMSNPEAYRVDDPVPIAKV